MEPLNNIKIDRTKNEHSESCGDTLTVEYTTWVRMKQRCRDKNRAGSKWYIEKGIKVCDRWINSYDNFLKDMGRRPSSKHSIDRIDSSGNYEPSNCRWATTEQQAENRKSTHFFTINGITKSLKVWCEHYNINHNTVLDRIFRGYSEDKLFIPTRKYTKTSPC